MLRKPKQWFNFYNLDFDQFVQVTQLNFDFVYLSYIYVMYDYL